jgi:hypothetical protein
VLGDDALRAGLAATALRVGREEFTWAANAARMSGIYAEVTA